ncbi:MAG: helix-turn-helix domain-containing protein [Lachnospiraceae bacterium]|nr:helix-turn-helix domain-containing protein [Lachnospiraceae bacterium]
MYRIMLADDEGIVIDSVKYIIEKEFGPECVIEFAKTGRSVIELAEKFRPDIAIMDIQMPGINGIEAMKEIRKTNENVVFIVMSAYDKFGYAKEAIRLGVLEYIMKPMKKDKLLETLKQAMQKVDEERNRRSNDLMIMEKLETVVPIIENGLVYNILFQEHFQEDIDNYCNLLGIEQKYFYMIAVVYGDDQEGNHMTNAVGSSVRMQKYYQEVRNSIKEYFNCVIGSIMSNKIAVLVPCDKEELDFNERVELIDRARNLTKELKKRVDASFRIGIGSVGEMKSMGKSYSNAINALVQTTSSVVHADDLSMNCDYDDDYPVEIEKTIFESVEQGDVNRCVVATQLFFDWMVQSNGDHIDNIRLKVLEFVMWAERIVYEKGGMTYRFCARQDYLQSVMNCTDYEQLCKWFVDKLTTCCTNSRSTQMKKNVGMISGALEYIKENYNKDISLVDVAREVDISPYYFSKVFKDETGHNFIEYLTNLRIEKAKELLLQTDLSMKEICLMVGYADPNYFSRNFKKNVGVTPTEYKENSTNDQTN